MPAIELVDIQKLGDVLKAAADAIAKLGDSIAHLVTLGAQGWDAASARRTHSRLIDLRKRLISYRRSQGAVASTFDGYVARIDAGRMPRQLDWTMATNGLLPLIQELSSLIEDLKAERSDFVLEVAYESLYATLDARLTLFQRLREGDAPRSPEQVEALRAAVAQWGRLRQVLGDASDALAAYLTRPS